MPHPNTENQRAERRALIVVNYTSHELLRRNLTRVAAENPGLDVIVVDCWSSAAERAEVQALCTYAGWTCVLADTNLGFGAGANRGAEVALRRKAETLIVLNPDAYLTKASLERLAHRVEDDPWALAAPLAVRPDGSVWSAKNDLYLHDGSIRATRKRRRDIPAEQVRPWVSGVCLAAHRDLWKQLDGFDEDYFMYWEDVDLSYRAQRLGAMPTLVDEAKVVHDEGGTQTSKPGRMSDLYFHYNVRGRALFARKHLNPTDQRRWRRHSPGAAKDILLRGGRRHLLTRIGPTKAALKGSVDGWRTPLRRTPTTDLRVMLSFPPPRPTSNPYNTMLADSLRAVPGVAVLNFSWRGALRADYEVFHAHWPEIFVDGASPLKKFVRQCLFLLLLRRLRSRSVPWVRTVHNLALPQGLSRRQAALLRLADRQTTLRIAINTSTGLPADQPHEVILHGDYTRWYEPHPKPSSIAGRILFFGTVRRYKAVPRLIEAFRATSAPDLSLRIVGRVSQEEYAEELRELSIGDSRISLALGFLDDPALVYEVGQAELVVLPYPEMHNSGSVLAALSLHRPVLVPDNEVNRKLADEVGKGWVNTFQGDLDASAIEDTLKVVRRSPAAELPNFSRREWRAGGQLHARAYWRAIALQGDGKRRGGRR